MGLSAGRWPRNLNLLERAALWLRFLERAAGLKNDHRYQLAKKHLRGIGLEIGALHLPLVLPRHARAYYLDRLLPSELRRHYPELGRVPFYVSVVGDGESLLCIRDECLDFIVANHLIEHLEDPIAALKAFAARLKPGAILFLAVPDMRNTFDKHRPETTWEHLLADHTQGTAISRASHFYEWAEKVDGLESERALQRASELQSMNYSIHFHCWTYTGFLSFLHHVQSHVPLRLLESLENGAENLFLLQKPLSREP